MCYNNDLPVYRPLTLDAACGIKSAEDTYVFPAQGRLAVLTVDICHSMQAGEQDSLLCGATPDVHPERGKMGLWGRKVERRKETEVKNLCCASCSVARSERCAQSESPPHAHSHTDRATMPRSIDSNSLIFTLNSAGNDSAPRHGDGAVHTTTTQLLCGTKCIINLSVLDHLSPV